MKRKRKIKRAEITTTVSLFLFLGAIEYTSRGGSLFGLIWGVIFLFLICKSLPVLCGTKRICQKRKKAVD